MSRTYHHGERRIRVKGVRRNPPDMKRMSRALMELAKAQAEVEAQALTSDDNDPNTTAESRSQSSKQKKRSSGSTGDQR